MKAKQVCIYLYICICIYVCLYITPPTISDGATSKDSREPSSTTTIPIPILVSHAIMLSCYHATYIPANVASLLFSPSPPRLEQVAYSLRRESDAPAPVALDWPRTEGTVRDLFATEKKQNKKQGWKNPDDRLITSIALHRFKP